MRFVALPGAVSKVSFPGFWKPPNAVRSNIAALDVSDTMQISRVANRT
jgi:hypothetical protein